jgi:glyoxylase-like metal-dependent hydrolase (beta-lactamase superfamily II)
MRGSESALTDGLARLRATPHQVLVTHGHIDHWGLAATLTDEVLGHAALRPSLALADGPAILDLEADEHSLSAEALANAFRQFERMTVGVPASVQEVEDGDRIGEWQVIWTPGHDPGHICLFRECDGVLICGDALLPDTTPNIQPTAQRDDALADFLATLARLEAMPVSLVLPSHGEPYTDHAARAKELTAFHARRLDDVLAVLDEGSRSLREVAATLFKSREGPIDDMLADMETLAHLDHLRLRGAVRRLSDGRWSHAVDPHAS